MTVYRIEIDRALCVGYGACAELAPDVFVLEGGLASIRVGASTDPAVAEAADLCPMSAITVAEQEAA
jgi:ferredoxin